MALQDAVSRAQESLTREVATRAVVDPNYSAEVLKLIGLNPNDPKAHAVVAVARRYNLDPVLGHIAIIPRSTAPYITRDGYLHIAHASGKLDGIEVLDGPRRDGREWVATIAVYRRDMSHAFVYPGRADLAADNGPEMAIARAERRALRRAFAVTLPQEFGDDDGAQIRPAPPPSAPQAPEPAKAPVTGQADPQNAPQTREPVRDPDGEIVGRVDTPPTPDGPRITNDQRRALFAECGRLGFGGSSETEREYRLTLMSRIVARPIDSINSLSEVEAALVITALRNMVPGEDFAPDTEGSKSNG